MASSKKYALVYYTDGSFEMLPTNWIFDGNRAVFPKNVGKLSVHKWKKMRQDREPPQDTWLSKECGVVAERGECMIS